MFGFLTLFVHLVVLAHKLNQTTAQLGLEPIHVWSSYKCKTSTTVKLMLMFVLFNKYYCVLPKHYVTYSTETQIHLNYTYM